MSRQIWTAPRSEVLDLDALLLKEFGIDKSRIGSPAKASRENLNKISIDVAKGMVESTRAAWNPLSLFENSRSLDAFILFRILSVERAKIQPIYEVEDEDGSKCRLMLNTAFGFWPAQKVQKGDIIIVYDPKFFKLQLSRWIVIVWHRSDWKILDPCDELVKNSAWGQNTQQQPNKGQRTRLSIKEEGNKFYQRNEYEDAIKKYNEALALKDDSSVPDEVLLRNRSLAERYLGLHDTVEATLRQALLKNSTDPKTQFELSKMLYCWRRYDECKQVLHTLLDRKPRTDGAAELNALLTLRIKERNTGDYDFGKMWKDAQEMLKGQSPPLFGLNDYGFDYADYTGPLELRDINPSKKHLAMLPVLSKGKPLQERSKGLFATRDIKFGELVLCSKAMCLVFTSKDPPANPAEPENLLVPKINEMLFDCQRKAERFYSLPTHHKGYGVEGIPRVNGKLVIDTDLTTEIVRSHNFRPSQGKAFAAQRLQYCYAKAVWDLPSYANHSCRPNIHASYFGDFLLYRAIQDIPVGTQLCISYHNPYMPYKERKEQLRISWLMCCTCQQCKYDSKESISIISRRESIAKQLFALSTAPEYIVTAAGFQEVSKLISDFDSTYTVPETEQYRTEMAAPVRVCQVALIRAGAALELRTIKLGMKSLSCLGWGFDEGKRIVRYGGVEWWVVMVMVNISISFWRRGERGLAQHWKGKAKITGVVYYGAEKEYKHMFEKVYRDHGWDYHL